MLKTVHNNSGQHTIEFLLLFTIVIVVIFVFMGPGGEFRTEYERSLNAPVQGMVDVAGMVWGDAAGTLTILNP
ncbi:MAG TPA: hypothetical protein PLB05_11085 [Candidatus Omnitrophota bacterium]|jgi:uncharacterized protein (UPF0333 family)|nr:hypothetical protein [Candidatus Omnitrophota bacterium]HPN56305.1 hypothetical protein [Candidatus Omnitrophota bacterium]